MNIDINKKRGPRANDSFFLKLGRYHKILNNFQGIAKVISENGAVELFNAILFDKDTLDIQKISNRADYRRLKSVCQSEPFTKELQENNLLRKEPRIKKILDKIDNLLAGTLDFPLLLPDEISLFLEDKDHQYKSLLWYQSLENKDKRVIDYLKDDFDKFGRNHLKKLESYPGLDFDVYSKSIFDELIENYQDDDQKLFFLSGIKANDSAYINFEHRGDEVLNALYSDLKKQKEEKIKLQNKLDFKVKDIIDEQSLENDEDRLLTLQKNIETESKYIMQETKHYLSKKIANTTLWISDIFPKNKNYSQKYIEGKLSTPTPIKITGIDSVLEHQMKDLFRDLVFDGDEHKEFDFGYLLYENSATLQTHTEQDSDSEIVIDISENFQNTQNVAFVLLHYSKAIIFYDFKQLRAFVQYVREHEGSPDRFNYITDWVNSFKEHVVHMNNNLSKDEGNTIFQVMLDKTSNKLKREIEEKHKKE